ncbi:hypothetical protein PL18_10835 [Vibrio renipiscarius]|uniref:Uncharacterized protein n=2 Tax=Vibrio renipiscarius TaxID=1461322 RepID=A0A0C2NGT6_9VIBR|nr:hypothetical protein OJ16_18725 [Vibrio renipiscarius]KII78776.1 hypothetical protein PL18_10835 [Vibrio renipiscarius]
MLYIPAFLASDLVLTSYDHNKFEQYKALTLVSVARLTFIGKHKSRIENICNDVRLFSRGDRESLAAYMPDIQVLDFPQLVAAFQELVNEEDNPDLPPPSIVNQLNHYRRPYEATLDYKDGYSRRSNTTTFTGSSKLETSEIKFLDDDSGDSLVELREIASHPTVSKQVWQTEDISSDVNRTISIVSTLSTSSNDYAANALHARAINARIQKKEMSLACDIESMTKFEIGAVINYCVTSILARDCIEKQAKALLIMLFTGNPFHLIKKLKARKNNKHQVIGFQRHHRVPSQKQRAEIRPLVANSLSSFWLPLPEMVCERLQSCAKVEFSLSTHFE